MAGATRFTCTVQHMHAVVRIQPRCWPVSFLRIHGPPLSCGLQQYPGDVCTLLTTVCCRHLRLSLCALQIYRTPFMLRYCCSILIHIGSVVLGPYFVHIGKQS
jgi:hypothetical protein